MLQGVKRDAQQCQVWVTPKFLQGSYEERSNAMYGSPRLLQGAAFCTQKCHNGCAPASFIWCQLNSAAMLIQNRTKGRVTIMSQKCQEVLALPNQLQGVKENPQQCHFHVRPRQF